MILARSEIEKLIEEGKLKIEPIFDDSIRENGIDLRIGNEYAIYAYENTPIDPCNIDDASEYFRIVKCDGKIVIPPRNFVLLTTIEYVKLPDNIIGLCNLRSTLARYGLSIPPTVVDAGFEGTLTIEVVNNSPNPIILRTGMRFLHLVLLKCEGQARYLGKYLGQRGVRPPKGLKDECQKAEEIIRKLSDLSR
ncbi:MAG: dCTP deaminase [Crenarchaeota archaeon]|nr:dCTP deaminase [Thermoproteota archaeon]